ncbi:MFS transporter, partial [Pauljensenia sp. UMB0018B]|nr:MFS transporter [Pauljensenia sp. UMB0018B]
MERESFIQSYKNLWQTVKTLFHKSPHLLYFLFASAIFRDGLSGVFTYGGMIAATTFGFSSAEVLLFGVAANVVAGIFTFGLGYFDDKFGPKSLMVLSLSSLVIAALAIFFMHDGGK